MALTKIGLPERRSLFTEGRNTISLNSGATCASGPFSRVHDSHFEPRLRVTLNRVYVLVVMSVDRQDNGPLFKTDLRATGRVSGQTGQWPFKTDLYVRLVMSVDRQDNGPLKQTNVLVVMSVNRQDNGPLKQTYTCDLSCQWTDRTMAL